MEKGNVLGEFRTRSFPYLFAIILLGVISGLLLRQSFLPDSTQYFAQYFLLILTFLFINRYTKLTIYSDKLVLQLIFFGTKDQIDFKDVQAIKSKGTVIRHSDRQADKYLLIVGEKRNYTLHFIMKEGENLEIDLNEYPDREEVLDTLKRIEL